MLLEVAGVEAALVEQRDKGGALVPRQLDVAVCRHHLLGGVGVDTAQHVARAGEAAEAGEDCVLLRGEAVLEGAADRGAGVVPAARDGGGRDLVQVRRHAGWVWSRHPPGGAPPPQPEGGGTMSRPKVDPMSEQSTVRAAAGCVTPATKMGSSTEGFIRLGGEGGDVPEGLRSGCSRAQCVG